MQIDAIAAPRRRPVELPRLQPRLSADNRLAIAAEPFADSFEPLDLLRRQSAVAHRAHIEEQITALAGDLAESMNQRARRFQIPVRRIVTPTIVDSEAGLPWPFGRARRHRLFRSLIIAIARDSIIVYYFGL